MKCDSVLKVNQYSEVKIMDPRPKLLGSSPSSSTYKLRDRGEKFLHLTESISLSVKL